MSTHTVPQYQMNPAEDVIVFGDELADGMLVLPEDRLIRTAFSFEAEERQLRAQRFRKVTRLRREGDLTRFVGEWIDGYQEVQRYNVCHAWLVKKDSVPAPEGDAS